MMANHKKNQGWDCDCEREAFIRFAADAFLLLTLAPLGVGVMFWLSTSVACNRHFLSFHAEHQSIGATYHLPAHLQD